MRRYLAKRRICCAGLDPHGSPYAGVAGKQAEAKEGRLSRSAAPPSLARGYAGIGVTRGDLTAGRPRPEGNARYFKKTKTRSKLRQDQIKCSVASMLKETISGGHWGGREVKKGGESKCSLKVGAVICNTTAPSHYGKNLV